MPAADRTTPQTVKKKIRRKPPGKSSGSGGGPQGTGRITAPRPAPRPKPTPSRPQSKTQIRSARAQQREHVSQGRSVQKQATSQRQVAQSKIHQAEYISQARAVHRVASDKGGRGPSLGEIARFATQSASGTGPVRIVKTNKLPGASVNVPKDLADRQALTGYIGTKAIRAMSEATAEDPVGVTTKTAKGLRDALTGIPGATVKVGLDTVSGAKHGNPLKGVENAAKGYGKDLSRRYGPLAKPGEKGVQDFKARVKKEGAAGELLDLSTLVTGTGAAAGRGAGTLARAGKLGKTAEKIATERPRLRVSGGESVTQKPSENLAVAAGQHAVDKARAKRLAKRVAKAEARGTRVSALDAEAVAQGEVTRVRRRSTAHQQHRSVAQAKGRALHTMKAEQGHEVGRGTNRNIASLSRHERQAFKPALELGIHDPVTAARVLKVREAQIVANRAAQGIDVPKVLRKTNDELPVLQHLQASPEKAFTPKLARIARTERQRAKRLAAGDPAMTGERTLLRTYAKQAELLGVTRHDGETAGAFVSRVRKAAKKEGLHDPGYFPSEKRPTVRYSDYALGGSGAVGDAKKYTGALYRTGREDTRPEVLSQALARNVKRKHNWNLVADNAEKHTFAWSRDKTPAELMNEIDRRGIDPRSVALWNPKRFYAAAKKADSGEVTAGEEPVVSGLTDAIDNSMSTVADLHKKPDDFQTSKGYSLIPRAVHDEIHADTRPSGPYARAFDVFKGKQSRLLLGTSPAWLQFQVASNALLTGLAGVGPVDAVKAQVWWHGLSKQERDAIEPYVGVGRFQDSVTQTKLGGAADNSLVNAYRAFKQTPFFQQPRRPLRGGAVKDLNPLDLLFRADNAQNNAFRRAVLYNQVKRDAYKRMGQNAGHIMERQRHLTGLLTLGPKEKMLAVVKDRAALEAHAQAVDDFLGDFTTYTAKERRQIGRPVMFYGFLRFSLRFTFWTMPTKHPIMSSIIANLGRLQTDEVRKLLGGDTLPYSLGKFYFTQGGKLKSINVSRMNPTLNTITGFQGVEDAIGFAPPIIAAAINQIASKTIYKDQAFHVAGEDKARPAGKYTAGQRGRIFLNQGLLDLLAPYRAWQTAVTKGAPQGDDSLLGDRPTKYSDRDKQLGLERRLKQDKSSFGSRLEGQFVPVIPQPDRARETAAMQSTYKALDAAQKSLDSLPKSRASSDGFYNSRQRQQLVDQIGKLKDQINHLQAQGTPAPASKSLMKRPLSLRSQIDKKMADQRKLIESGGMRAKIEEEMRRAQARQQIEMGGG